MNGAKKMKARADFRRVVQTLGFFLIVMPLICSFFIFCDLNTRGRLDHLSSGWELSEISFSDLNIFSDFKHFVVGSPIYININVKSKDNESMVALGFCKIDEETNLIPSTFHGIFIDRGYCEGEFLVFEPGQYRLVTRKEGRFGSLSESFSPYYIHPPEAGYFETQEKLTMLSIFMFMVVAGSSIVQISRKKD